MTIDDLMDERDELRAALKCLLPHAEALLKLADCMDGVCNKLNVEYDIEQAKAALDKAEAP